MLSAKQKALVDHAHEEGTFCFAGGAIRSGKTFGSMVAFALFTQSLEKPYKHLLSGRKLRVIEAEMLPVLQQVCTALGVGYEYRRYDNTVMAGNQQYILLAGNDEKSQDRALGLTIHSGIMDEVTLVPEVFFKACVSRLTFGDGKFWMCSNPSFPRHWLKKDWIDAGKFEKVLTFLFDDNPSLTKEVKERNRSLFSGVFARRMVEGQWCATEGLIWPDITIQEIPWQSNPNRHTIVAVDYGVANPTVALVLSKFSGGVHVADELYLDGGPEQENKTDREIAVRLEIFCRRYEPAALVLDPSAASLRELLLREPWRRNIALRRGRNEVLPGIRIVGTLARAGDLTVDPKCGKLLDEIASYRWHPDKDDTPIKEHDHACDALRYGVMDISRVSQAFTKPEGL